LDVLRGVVAFENVFGERDVLPADTQDGRDFDGGLAGLVFPPSYLKVWKRKRDSVSYSHSTPALMH
jgi:hypothetical protein